MPFIANTPESRLARTDSKRPDATCRGITSNGRPCRRPIASSSTPPSSDSSPGDGSPGDGSLYCWQHKDQAGHHSSPGRRGASAPHATPRANRSSLDTLADRLGLVDLNAQNKTDAADGPRPKNKKKAKESEHGAAAAATARERQHESSKMRGSREKKQKTVRFCFCFSMPLEEEIHEPAPRPHRPRPQPRPVQKPDQRQSAPVPNTAQHSKRPQQLQQQQQQIRRRPVPPPAAASSSSPGKHSHHSAKSTTAAHLKSLIPDSLDAATASALMAELARPVSGADEPGYIYMFWLTPASGSSGSSSAAATAAAAPVPIDAARSLLAPPSRPRPSSSRRPSDVVSSFAAASAAAAAAAGGGGGGGSTTTTTTTMLLKIGRAANVQRRMNQWQRQCGHSIQMLRFYPYIPSSSSSSPSPSSSSTVLLDPEAGDQGSSTTPRTTPHCKKVERLVQLELSGMGLRAKLGTCEACGREHREWFEVEASREGIRRVDEVIRRWTDWDLGAG